MIMVFFLLLFLSWKQKRRAHFVSCDGVKWTRLCLLWFYSFISSATMDAAAPTKSLQVSFVPSPYVILPSARGCGMIRQIHWSDWNGHDSARTKDYSYLITVSVPSCWSFSLYPEPLPNCYRFRTWSLPPVFLRLMRFLLFDGYSI